MIEKVVGALEAHGCHPRSVAGGVEARCPAHEDHRPSLSVNLGDTGAVVLTCHRGCATADVLAALNLTFADLFPPETNGRKAGKLEIVAEYRYVDHDGALLFTVTRAIDAEGRKTFFQTPASGKKGAGAMKGVPRVLYRLPEVLKALDEGRRVWIVEGEKDADALAHRGEVATCNPQGAGKWLPEHAEVFRDARSTVTIVADKDAPGLAHARKVRASLASAGVVAEIVEAWKGKDAHDALAAVQGAIVELADVFVPVPEDRPEADEAKEGAAAPEQPGPDGSPGENEHARRPMRLYTLADLAALPPPRWLVDGVLQEDTFAVLFGPSGLGKSVFALDLALTIASDVLWFGAPVKAGPVAYLALEGQRGIAKRVEAWQHARQVGNLAPRIAFGLEPVNLLDGTEGDRTLAAIEAMPEPPAMVVVDTMARAMVGGDENSAKDVGLLIANLDRIRAAFACTVLLIHHTGHDESRARGSTVLRAAADTMLQLASDGTSMTFRQAKQKDAPELSDVTYHLEPTLDSVTIVRGSSADKLAAPERALLQFVRRAFPDAEVAGRILIDAVDLKRTRAYVALKNLTDAGLLASRKAGQTTFYTITPEGILEADQPGSSGSSGIVRDGVRTIAESESSGSSATPLSPPIGGEGQTDASDGLSPLPGMGEDPDGWDDQPAYGRRRRR